MEAFQESCRIAVYARRAGPGVSSVGHAHVQLWGPGFKRVVQENMRAMSRGRTAITIAHRLAAVHRVVGTPK